MNYFDLSYAFLFLPIVIIIYNIMPKKIKPVILLIASFVFFFMISKFLIVFLILSILSVYIGALFMKRIDKKKDALLKLMESAKENEEIKSFLETTEKVTEKKDLKKKYKNKKKLVLILVILFNVAFLFAFKYLKFFTLNTNFLLNCMNVGWRLKLLKFAAPIGISFYTLQALSYIIDVYNEKVDADRNILRVSLFLSFFPQIMEGPIARYSQTAKDLYERISVNYHNLCFGYQRILFGFFKKFIIADRLNVVVGKVFGCYESYSGISIACGIIAYTIMLYMEFSGTMDVVIGSGEIFNVKIPENFRQPFFAKNISEFWSRWHISLGAWFKDYIFYPVSLSKPMKKITLKARKVLGNHLGALISGAVALFVVWFLNGLWHGAGWTFLFYGMYQFLLILSGNIAEPFIKSFCAKLKINRQNIFYRIFQSIKMTGFVLIGELFFRAPTVSAGFGMLKRMFTNFKISALTNGEVFSLGIDKRDCLIIFLALIVVFIIGILRERNINVRESISKKNIFVRWSIYYALILAIIIFGAYGTGYIPVDPIYADF